MHYNEYIFYRALLYDIAQLDKLRIETGGHNLSFQLVTYWVTANEMETQTVKMHFKILREML